jgi:hypothetical protein
LVVGAREKSCIRREREEMLEEEEERQGSNHRRRRTTGGGITRGGARKHASVVLSVTGLCVRSKRCGVFGACVCIGVRRLAGNKSIAEGEE